MYTFDNKPVDGWGEGMLKGLEGPVSGVPTQEGGGTGQPPTEAFAPETVPATERYTRVTIAPEEIAPIASAAEAKELVGQLQSRLQASGFDPGKIDGVWGPKTSAALNKVRAAAKLPEGTERFVVIQQGLGVDPATASRMRDAINFQLAARAVPGKALVKRPEGGLLSRGLPAAAVGLTKKWWVWALLVVGLGAAGTITYFVIKKRGESEEEYEEGGEGSVDGFESVDEDDEDF